MGIINANKGLNNNKPKVKKKDNLIDHLIEVKLSDVKKGDVFFLGDCDTPFGRKFYTKSKEAKPGFFKVWEYHNYHRVTYTFLEADLTVFIYN